MKLSELIRDAKLENEERQENLTLLEQEEIEEALDKIENILWKANDRKIPRNEADIIRQSDFI